MPPHIPNVSGSSAQPGPAARVMPRWWDVILYWSGLNLGAYVGVLLRIGLNYLSVWRVEANLTVMYCQIFGCLLMGFATQHKNALAGSSWHTLCYVIITSGLCGSLTTFSSWELECNKILFLQLDRNAMTSAHGGPVFAWALQLSIGIVLPLSALHAGNFHP